MSELSLALFKRCSKCRCWKPAARNFFHPDKRKALGLTSACKVCVNLTSKRWRENNPEAARASFAKYRERNTEAINEYRRRRWLEEPDRLREIRKRSDAKNAAKIKTRTWKWREKNAERVAQRRHDWNVANPEAVKRHHKVKKAKRRALLNQATGTISPVEVQAMYEDQNGLCAYCECRLNGDYTLDHMIPLTRGGSNDWTNIAIACRSCNSRKHTKTAEEFMPIG